MSLIKLTAKHKKKKPQGIAHFTPGGSVVAPWLLGSSAGMVAGLATGKPALGPLGGLAGLGAGVALHHHLKEKGEFKKKVLPNYKGTITGWGAFGANAFGGPIGTGIYHGVKLVRHDQVDNR